MRDMVHYGLHVATICVCTVCISEYSPILMLPVSPLHFSNDLSHHLNDLFVELTVFNDL